MKFTDLNDDSLLKIFVHLNLYDAQNTLKLTCKGWANILSSEDYWSTICDLRRRIFPYHPDSLKKIEDVFVALGLNSQCYQFRLISPIYLVELFSLSKVEALPELIIEKPPVGCDCIEAVPWCWASTYHWSTLRQDILVTNTMKRSLSMMSLQNLCMRLQFVFSSRFDQATNFKVSLLFDGSALPGFGEVQHHNPAGVRWKRFVKHYPLPTTPFEKISFDWKGKDQTFWAGHYGAKIANISISFVVKDESLQDEISDI